MLFKVIIPDLGATGGDVLLTQWLVSEGDFVESGTPLFVVETDKATDEVQAFRSGFVRNILARDGAEVELGAVVALMTDTADESLENNAEPIVERPDSRNAVRSAEPVGSSFPLAAGYKPRASPRARKLAEELSVDLSQVTASAENGVISAGDVERFAASVLTESTGARSIRVAPSRARRAIADITALSKSQIPHFYLFIDFDLTNVEAERARLRAIGSSPPTVTELIVYAAAQSLDGSPLNGRYVDDQLEIFNGVDIGLMIGLKGGVVVPVIKQSQRMDLPGLRQQIRHLRARAEADELTSRDMRGGGLSISNLGMHGVDFFAGIILPGQSCLLSLGRVTKQPRYIGDRLEPRSIMTACLSVDHRVTDGLGAAGFLNNLKQRIESWPETESRGGIREDE
jgi:pyruvate dehydrogenase E2 component (dihydrolipoamide acetyltransferase)